MQNRFKSNFTHVCKLYIYIWIRYVCSLYLQRLKFLDQTRLISHEFLLLVTAFDVSSIYKNKALVVILIV